MHQTAYQELHTLRARIEALAAVLEKCAGEGNFVCLHGDGEIARRLRECLEPEPKT
jgi:hypothetical protein